jgi:DTW domain-containing protein YfiP
MIQKLAEDILKSAMTGKRTEKKCCSQTTSQIIVQLMTKMRIFVWDVSKPELNAVWKQRQHKNLLNFNQNHASKTGSIEALPMG